MIKRDISYIFKRIIIGIGIILGISFIRSCNVYALEDTSNMTSLFNSTYFGHNYSVYLDSANNRIYGKRDTTEQFVDINGYDYMVILKPSNGSRITQFCVFNKTPFVYNNTIIVSEITYQRKCFDLATSGTQVFTVSSGTFSNYNNGIEYSNRFNYLVNFDLKDSNNNILQSKNLDIPWGVQPPEIVSLNPVLNKTDDNMLVSVSFSPEFSYIDTENYNYYTWFDGYDKLKLTQNNVKINTQNNTTFYVEITDKQGNSIDTETYTVSSIGLVYNGDYDIQFKTEDYTETDTVNNSDAIFDIINRVDIDILYIPKWINYVYQYQYVENGNSLTNNWITVNNNNDDNNIVVSVNSNGKMYARILDSNNNVLKTSDYEITSVGQLKSYDNNANKIFTMFNRMNNNINFGGPISNLITIPVNVIETILQAGNNICSPYYLGTINGHPLTLSCINPEDYLGSALWSTIDIIVSGCMIYSIFKWLTSLYWSFVIMSDTPDIDANNFGDRRDLK